MTVEIVAPVIKLDGKELSPKWVNALVDMRIELAFRLVGRCTLRFTDPGYALAESSRVGLGKALEVHARDKGMLIKAEVTGVTVEHRIGDTPALVVVAHDKAHRLAHATKIDTFVKMTYSDVVKKIAADHGLTPSVDSCSEVEEFLMQADSDLALLDSLADRVGYDWWVDDKTLCFKKPTEGDTVQLSQTNDLLSFSVRASGLHPDTVQVDGWDRKQQRGVSGSSPASAATLKPESKLANEYVSPGSKLGGSATLVSAGASAMSPAEAKTLSTAITDQIVASAVVARGVLHGNPKIRPGTCVEILDSGPITGKYHVTKVEHIFRPTGFETHFVAGDRRPTSLVDTLGGASRPSALHYGGLVVGQVTNIKDDEKMGRVKVRYPGLASDKESGWARVVTMGGGADRGMVFLPEVGDEVLVGFEGGDLRQPVVLGGLYGSKSTIPNWDIKDGKVNGRRITSRLGHIVELGDGAEDTAQHVLLQLAGGKSKLRVGKDKVDLEVPSGVPIAIKSGEGSITIGKDGSITLNAPNITIQADQKVSITSKGQAELKSQTTLAMEGSAQTTVKGGMMQVEASGIAEIKGSMVKIN